MSETTMPTAVEELTEEEGRALFDRAAMRELNVSGPDFLAAYDGGSLSSEWSAEAVNRLEMLLPFAR